MASSSLNGDVGRQRQPASGSHEAVAAAAVAHAADTLPLHPADKRAPAAGSAMCVRCKTRRSTIAVQTTKFCTECFQFSFQGKVRPVLEQARICTYIQRTEREEAAAAGAEASSSIPPAWKQPSGRIALALSGGPSSRAMLRMAKERLLPAKDVDTRRDPRRHEVSAIDVLYVDDGTLLDGMPDDKRTEEVRALVEEEGGAEAGLHFVSLHIEDAFQDAEAVQCTADFKARRSINRHSTAYDDSGAALTALFDAIRPRKVARTALANARSRAEDLHRLLIVHLLRREARRRCASCLLTGENATRRAVRMIEGLGRGQGHKMPMEERPIRWHGVFLLRPMADVSSKEIAFYLRSLSMTALVPKDMIVAELLVSDASEDSERGVTAMAGGSGAKASMARLTESLINLLEGNVPGTINTVNRTSDKLVFHEDPASHLALLPHEQESFNETAFQRVGPALPLRRRKQAAAAAAARATTETTVETNPSSITSLEKNVRGLGLGGPGAKYFFAAKQWPQYNGERACPLCEMPAQRGLDAWRSELTVSGAAALAAPSPDNNTVTTIDLSSLLCYACGLLLDTPESTPAGLWMPLPAFVLHGALARLNAAEAGAA